MTNWLTAANEEIFKFRYYVAPITEDADMRQRDLAAEMARRHYRQRGLVFDVVSINRGPKNLIVRGLVK